MFGTDLPVVWVDYADRSYLITRLLWFTGFMLDAPVSSHRTIELYLKGFLVSHGSVVAKGKAAWGHNLNSLAEACIQHDSAFSNSEFMRRVRYFQRYFDMVRYPAELRLLQDDRMIWFSFDSCISPLDEIVAFVRPRVVLQDNEWLQTTLNSVFNSSDPNKSFQKKALIDSNAQIEILICYKTDRPNVSFDTEFAFDLSGC